MKKVFLSTAFMLVIALSTAFAKTGPGIGEELQATFEKEFSGAVSVNWKETDEYFKANFIFQGSVTEAYFNKEGQLTGSIRALFFNQLPMAVIIAVNKRFADADVLDVYEINNDNGTLYRLTLTSEKRKYRLMLDASGSIQEKTKLKN